MDSVWEVGLWIDALELGLAWVRRREPKGDAGSSGGQYKVWDLGFGF